MRHPLQELPLEAFIPLEHRFSTKRPVSPNATLLSPSKRRILNAEGIHSPDKNKKRIYNTSSSSLFFSELVGSPRSPARELEFAAPVPRLDCVQDASSRPKTPMTRTIDRPRLAPSPSITSSAASSAFTSASPHHHLRGGSPTRAFSHSTHISREIPTTSDHYSIHWPGFDVRRDTHIAFLTTEPLAHTTNAMDISSVEDTKENIRPRKRVSKRLAPDEWKVENTPKHTRLDKQAPGRGTAHIMSSPGRIEMTPDERRRDRRQMKLIMVREQDQEADDEQDIDQQL